MAAFPEQILGMRFLEISRTNFSGGNMGCNREHWYARAMAIEEPVDQMQIAGSAASGADRKRAGQVRLGAGGKRRNFFVAHMHPLYSPLASDRVRQPVKAVANDAVYAPNACLCEDLCDLISNGGHGFPPTIRH